MKLGNNLTAYINFSPSNIIPNFNSIYVLTKIVYRKNLIHSIFKTFRNNDKSFEEISNF